ncbi:hypothetical protein SteCoe_20780 [Stentor coeruleus]|uniref:Methyltransferase type 11 domain-containing protein n=1 Tax=Stentor coeruleus TaxID=5963 RepID=A0A1R2BR22_9CILI|nr:hypothetical protein SteCoe_20780 [Stentor coeruleus]
MASSQYGRPEYWEERYLHKKESFEWYQHWGGIKDIITQYVLPSHRILHAGCGTSSLPFEMKAEGYTNIVNMDNSKVLIDYMQETYQGQGMKWDLKDVRKMDNYPNLSFGAVIEKGLLDSILCGDRSRIMAKRMLDEIHRVLADNGVYISVTHAAPELRKHYFEGAKWAVRDYKIFKPQISSPQVSDEGVHYVYVCSKR